MSLLYTLLTFATVSTIAIALPLAQPAPQPSHHLFTRQDIQTPLNASLPNVTIFATGGTIASQGSSSTQTVGYQVGLGVSDLISAVPEILSIANIAGYQISNVGSGSINSSILLSLHRQISAELAKPTVSGVLVTHGTDTLEETAFFLDLTTTSAKPIICVGAMRPATALSADGPLNLVQAVTLAASPNAVGRGTMITLNDRIGSAFYTTKNNANSLDTFTATEMGQLGFFINQVPYFYYEPAEAVGKTHFEISEDIDELPQVDILYAHQDMDVGLFNASVASGAQGIVVAGVGAGGMSSKANTAAEAVYNATGVPIVASHRSADGFVPSDEDDFTIAAGFFNPQKARVMLQLGIAEGMDEVEIRDVFAMGYPDPKAAALRRRRAGVRM